MPEGRKVKGTIHWVSAQFALDAEVRLYDRLFTVPNPGRVEDGKTFQDYINPDSLKVLHGCKVEPSLAGAAAGSKYQFERKGFFCVDPDSKPGSLIFNLTIPLRDTWAKIEHCPFGIDISNRHYINLLAVTTFSA